MCRHADPNSHNELIKTHTCSTTVNYIYFKPPPISNKTTTLSNTHQYHIICNYIALNNNYKLYVLHTHSLSLSLTHTHTRTLSRSLSLSLSHTHTHTPTLTCSLSLSLIFQVA